MTSFLRNMTPGQQVGLLFVVVFSMLMLVTALAFGMSLKDRHGDAVHPQKLKEFNRLLSTSWLMTSQSFNWRSEGRSVTGATGLLDRVDALCFAPPVFFYSVC